MRQGRPKMAQPASKLSPDGPKWARLGPLLGTLEVFLAPWCIPLCIFMHFYQLIVNTCAFSMKSHGKHRKIQQIAMKMMNIAQTHIKSAYKCAKMRQGRPKMAQSASKVNPCGPKCVHLVPLLRTSEAFLAT